jgi:hypothetical protein
VKLTAEQGAKAVEYLGGPCKIEQAARMLGVPYPVFWQDWTTGRADAEAGRDTDAADWYLACQSARARYIATTRSEAQAVAGSRESSDLLALAREIENDEGPLAGDEDDVRKSSPLLNVTDRLSDPTLPEDARATLKSAHEDASRSLHALFSAIATDDARKRGTA